VLCGNSTDSIGCPFGYYCRTGPPDVCCPDHGFSLGSLLNYKSDGDIRRAPHAGSINHAAEESSSSENKNENDIVPSEVDSVTLPPLMCPDGSDSLQNEDRTPVHCGAGFDGMPLCPAGYYCSIDPDRKARLCCPMGLLASNLPAPPVIAPYFGHRKANPGEVIERGSLPSDPKPRRMPPPKNRLASLNQSFGTGDPMAPRHQVEIKKQLSESSDENAAVVSNHDVATTAPQVFIQNKAPDGKAPTDSTSDPTTIAPTAHVTQISLISENATAEPFGHLMLKEVEENRRREPENENRLDETGGIDIDAGTESSDPFDSVDHGKAKISSDASVCQIKPSEGRFCVHGENAPKTNLHYYYSVRDKKCKLYFYKGCGGNSNRFEKLSECEALCSLTTTAT